MLFIKLYFQEFTILPMTLVANNLASLGIEDDLH